MKCKQCNTELMFDENLVRIYESFTFNYQSNTHKFSLPEICFSCTEQKLLSITNERNIYKSQESIAGKDIISMYSPDKNIKVYEKDYWMNGNWDALEYGKEFDSNITFFSQFENMRRQVPVIALNIINCENCDFNNNLIGSKDSYMCFGNESLEDCLHVTASFSTKSSIDVWWSTVENCYEIFNC